MPDLELLAAVRRIAVDAGERILDIYRSGFDVSVKSDDSPVTQADLAAHHCIVEALARLAPALPVLSEEGRAIGFAERGRWSRYWLVDPLDGTKEFIRRNDEFTVNIALIDRGEAVLGIVHAPALGVCYSAARGVCTFRGRVAEGVYTDEESIRCRTSPERPTFVVSRSHRDAELAALLARLPAHEATSRGSSLKFCLVAEGSADLYPRTGPTSEWDTAAGQCVAEVAGARVRTLPHFQHLRYNRDVDLINPGFVVIGDPAAPWARQLET